jgi:hypothetical protein
MHLQAPDKATYIEVGFEKGDPVTLDGVALSPAAMLTALNKVAGDNGIGRIDIVESRFVGVCQAAQRSSSSSRGISRSRSSSSSSIGDGCGSEPHSFLQLSISTCAW